MPTSFEFFGKCWHFSFHTNFIRLIVKTDYKTAYNSWYGYTGGFALSASVPANARFYGYIGNNSSDTVTVNWATIDY